ncbi:metalloregulator ArsR/SmtB family transcription factor [Nocardioides koreensis]|uniref:Metalloregulator ArsR/SmtB family transcription factor n=1 Tax=Nocardioides koreensis TaxID=433651 RepID=A0ABN2ZI29_9ACTN
MSTTTDSPEQIPSHATELPVIAACCTTPSSVSDTAATELARMFKALGDPARVKIMSMLLNADEVCACDFSASIEKTAATTSHHLKLLRDVGLVATEKRGTWVYYRVVPERLAAVRDALAFTC